MSKLRAVHGARILVVIAAYAIAMRVDTALEPMTGVPRNIWPTAGIGLAVLVLWGRSLWPAVALAAFVDCRWDGIPAAVSLGIAAGDTSAALCGAWLMNRLGEFRYSRLDTPRDVLTLIGPVALGSTWISAVCGVTSAWLGGIVPSQHLLAAVQGWWVGDALASLTIAPVLFALPQLRLGPDWRARSAEALLTLTVLVGIVVLVFFGGRPRSWMSRSFLVFPPLLWAALRFYQPGAVVGTAALAGISIAATAADVGPFVDADRGRGAFALETFICVAAMSSLVLAAVSFERTRALRALERELIERRALEAQLVVSDRLAAMGRLAAGVGHEINNPLAYLMMALDRVRKAVQRRADSAPDLAAEVQPLLEVAREGTERMRGIVAALELLARNDDSVRGPVDLRPVLDSCLELAQSETEGRARIVREYDDVPSVEGNQGRLAQVFLSLLINAAEAIPPGHVEDNEIRVAARAEAGQVLVEVSDTGTGIEPAMRAHLFEPFFTTKVEGVGLGLSI